MTVYVVQNQKEVDTNSGQLQRKFDFTPAEKFGEIEYLLSAASSPFNIEPVINELHEKLRNFTCDDYLLLTGNPVILGLAVAIAADHTTGDVKMLQWSGAKRCYIPIQAENIFLEDTGCL